MAMKKKLMCILLSASMLLFLLAGCGGSSDTGANSSEAEKSETVAENAGSEVTEIAEAEEPVMEAQESSTTDEPDVTEVIEHRYLVKTEKIYIPLSNGVESFFDEREYDYDELGHVIRMHFYNYEGQRGDVYYEYELDDEGRIIKQQKLNGNKEKTGYIEYSYTGDHYKSYEYNNDGWLFDYFEGFVKDGVYYKTERIVYDSRKQKTEADEDYVYKVKMLYEGTTKVKSESFNKNGEKTDESYYENEFDENNNLIVEKSTIKDIETGEERPAYIIEYTYIEF